MHRQHCQKTHRVQIKDRDSCETPGMYKPGKNMLVGLRSVARMDFFPSLQLREKYLLSAAPKFMGRFIPLVPTEEGVLAEAFNPGKKRGCIKCLLFPRF